MGYLDRVLESLKNQTYKFQNLIVIVDIPGEYVIDSSKLDGFDNVTYVKSYNTRPAFAISERRQHIVNIHNQLRDLIGDADWVFSVEDDGILPPDALRYLVQLTETVDNVGMVTGVELGRWGVPYVGAWRVDDIHNPKKVTSLAARRMGYNEYDEIDGCGLYCALIRADLYKSHVFNTHNGLGPDVNLGLYCRQQGYKNYINWGVPVTHLTNRYGIEMEIPATDLSQIVELSLLGSNTWSQIKYPFGTGQLLS